MTDKPAQRATQPIPQPSRNAPQCVVHNYDEFGWCRSCKVPGVESQTSNGPSPLNSLNDGRDDQPALVQPSSSKFPYGPIHPYPIFSRPRLNRKPFRQFGNPVPSPATVDMTPPVCGRPDSTPRPDEGFLAEHYNLQPDDGGGEEETFFLKEDYRRDTEHPWVIVCPKLGRGIYDGGKGKGRAQ